MRSVCRFAKLCGIQPLQLPGSGQCAPHSGVSAPSREQRTEGWLQRGVAMVPGPIFVFPRIHPLTWDDSSLRSEVVLSTWPFHIVKCIIIMCNEKLSFLNVLRETSIGAEFGQFLLFWKFCEFLLVFTQQVFLYFGISLRNKVSRRKLCRKKPLNPNSQSRRVSLHLVSLWLILHTNPLLLRRHQADWRK